MSKTTPSTLALTQAGIAFDLHPYPYDPDAPRVGLQAAEALGIDPDQTFKTLMAELDGKPVCVVVPSPLEVSMKKLAAHFGGKSANMMKVPDAERLTGFKVGGISPFGQKKTVPTAIDETAQLFDTVYINAGQRGLLLSIAPDDAARVLNAGFVDLMA
ncbi:MULTISPECIES: Cys-tRNA(Pro) deacylase [Asticcacaulis]|uniref:Cys-tRNA(Pro) deacylase n=1 Tax=Asticcacaulis TaxID=76890 RepID=UPI001AE80D11|nr:MULTISPECIES: Cys-tRNA(Pro) deacylase [Asticcacaulis]MBP2159603.1 Cys-tRNA(Pro)/Cys-tRNA(Cys) deacylase [Asticcacaulis solisilvae]MDR6800570.1 Cys-tRNA(Pro)/Cys-tRNA(Cys) deacylase [Asticcacaulis sp. BE141]